ncbi:MAG: YegP family protein [Gammaproteobacteria bacterium]
MAGKFEIYTDKKGEFRYRLKAGNGEIILSGQGYKSAASCANGVASVQKNSGDEARYERKVASSGKHYFVLKAANHQVIGQSGMYSSADAMETGLASVKKNGSTANVDDQTG